MEGSGIEKQLSSLSRDRVSSLAALEERVRVIEDELRSTALLDGNEAKGTLRQIFGRLDILQYQEIDAIITSDLTSGKLYAKHCRKALHARVEAMRDYLVELFSRLEEDDSYVVVDGNSPSDANDDSQADDEDMTDGSDQGAVEDEKDSSSSEGEEEEEEEEEEQEREEEEQQEEDEEVDDDEEEEDEEEEGEEIEQVQEGQENASVPGQEEEKAQEDAPMAVQEEQEDAPMAVQEEQDDAPSTGQEEEKEKGPPNEKEQQNTSCQDQGCDEVWYDLFIQRPRRHKTKRRCRRAPIARQLYIDAFAPRVERSYRELYQTVAPQVFAATFNPFFSHQRRLRREPYYQHHHDYFMGGGGPRLVYVPF